MLAVNFFWFWNTEWASEVYNETIETVNVENVSKELVSSWAWDFLLISVLWVSIFFAIFVKKFA